MIAYHNDWDTSAQRSESSGYITYSSDPEIVEHKAEMVEINKNVMKVLQINQQVKAITHSCENYGGPHAYNDYLTTVGQTLNVYATGAYNQGGNSYQPQVKRVTKVIKDTVPRTNNRSTKDVQPLVVQVETQEPNFKLALVVEPVEALISSLKPNPKPSIPYPSRLNDQKLCEKANNQMDKFFQIFQDLQFNISFADALILMPKFASTINSLLTNKEKLFELGRTSLNENCSEVLFKKLPEKLGDPVKFLIPCDFPGMDECLALADLGASINLMPLSVWKKLSLPKLSPTCMTFELEDRSISRPVSFFEDVSVIVGKFHFPADLVVVDFDADPQGLVILERSFLKNGRALIDVYEGEFTLRVGNKAITLNLDQTSRYSSNYDDISVNRIDVINVVCEEYSQEVLGFSVELKDLPPHLEYAFLEGDDKLTVITAKDLKDEEKTTLIKVWKSHKRALAWQLFDIKSINPEFCTHKILMEDDFKPAVQHQRRVNPKIYKVIKKEVLKLLDAGLIYPISDSPWVSLVHCVPKKGGFTVVENEENELIPTRFVTRWHVCIDNRKLNDATHKDQFPLPFMDQMLERLAGNDFSVFRNSFGTCLSYLDKMLKHCEDTNLYLNWEKSHFMVKEGIILGHKISKHRIKVDKAKVDVIAKLPHPTTIKDAKPRLLRWVLLLQEFDMIIRNKKEAKNLAANHFPRLENPHKSVLDKKEINEAFPLETLNMIKSSGGVFTARKPLIFLRLATMDPSGNIMDLARDIMDLTTSPKRHLTPVSISPHFIVIPMTWSNLVTLVNIREKSCNVMKCLKMPSKFTGSSMFGTPRAIISVRGTHFCNDQFAKGMLKYGVTHRLATAYHPQTNKLDDALWAFCTAFKTPIGCTLYQLVYEKACHLLIELEHEAYWDLKHCNYDFLTAGDHQKVQLNELNELRDQAYENSLIYKEKTKRIHDPKIKDRIFNVGDRVFHFKSRLKIFLGKLKTRWTGPFTVTQVFPYGTIELSQIDGQNFKVNGNRLKHYFRGDIPPMVVSDLQTFPMDN
uniref:Reverse transcriptase domain-containing protein n=1 Tax=Tanacetum cinerariifolium TaxID=118510 RepID=A0A6L2MMK6_TANCI|nr:reverse transcriptase domain-containing protein [Tanacetum cinerariifolium]